MYQQIIEKSFLGSILYVFSFLLQFCNEMIVVLAILMMFDWITGVVVAKREGIYDATKGSWGAVKKFMYIMLVVCGFLADITIVSFSTSIGVPINTHGALGFAVIFYLIGNEGVSIYTNSVRLGLPVPQFLNNIYNNFRLMAKISVNKTNKNIKEVVRNDEDS